jgi:NAD(P)-dependent dehydrogenase (short-subunit alcohol dehydrogenase family)
MRTMTPTGRDFLSVGEMTGAAVFLASDDALAIRGATLMVDAGWSAI